MFDSVLRPDQLPKSKFGSGAVIATVVHAAVIAFALWASARVAKVVKDEIKVTFVKPPPPPPPPPPAAPKENRPKPKPQPNKPVTVLQQAIVAPTVIPEEKPEEKEPTESQGIGEGVEGGEVGGVPGGIVGGVVDAADVAKPVEFDPHTMKDPVYVSGPAPQYTEKALEKEIQGVMVVKCVVTVDGRIHDCRIVRSLPFLDRAVIEALEKRRYAPATQGGRPIEVDYTFKVTMRLPE
ncbi:MAG TPA: energy transducer TonB [Anaeromyxobacteraceae bacterium]|nr:energy transducer TonB [Anaeromyxobacteraceae bacterium]